MKPYLLILTLLFRVYLLSAQNRYDVIIDEIMPDPSPAAGLPEYEWIELRNISATPIQLETWRFADASGQTGPMPAFLLQPDSCVIVCGASAASTLNAWGRVIAVSGFPSLDNEGELIWLKAPGGMTVHAVNYSSSWHDNQLKKQGGWSLEMIDPSNPCSGSANWKSAIDARGGSPGQINSIDGETRDEMGPKLKYAHTVGRASFILVFDEPIDSNSGATISNYSIDGGLSISDANPLPPYFNQVQLNVNTDMQENIIYTITVANLGDCKGNRPASVSQIKSGMPAIPGTGDVVINEILVNPLPAGYDFIELYNSSHHIIDASLLSLANRNAVNSISSMTRIGTNPLYIFPGEYLVVTEDTDNLALHYFVKNPSAVQAVKNLPSFPDDKGSVVVLNSIGEITDEVNYNSDWHFKLLSEAEGVSLERIDPLGPSQDASNWHSAAATAGSGTPGYKNSQFRLQESIRATVGIIPPVFSPDNDGTDDIASIHYFVEEPGYIANITIFDVTGKPVKRLVNNGVMGLSGYWNWDGLDDIRRQLPVGIYVVFTEIFNLGGKKEKFKNTIILGRKP